MGQCCCGVAGSEPAGSRSGHADLGAEVAERFGFSPAAVAVLRVAVDDPVRFEGGRPEAHARSPEAAALADGEARERGLEQAVAAFESWVVDRLERARQAVTGGEVQAAVYHLGYALHGVIDLSAHAGGTASELAPLEPELHDGPSVDLARAYGFHLLRQARELLGAPAFELLRDHSGGAPLTLELRERLAAPGPSPAATAPATGSSDAPPVRWARERVLGAIATRLRALPRPPAASGDASAPGAPTAFEPLLPLSPAPEAAWTVIVYMAGDDTSPDGIEYAVRQDLLELKAAGSTDQVHLIAQTDEVKERFCYRYRLRQGTSLEADRLAVFRGDLNTGRTSTLVELVAFARTHFPARRYALVLWGHGSGHDDHDVYRLARGQLSPRVAAELARKRLGFFGSTRRALLERGGPARGYGYDDTSGDFLDDVELQTALKEIQQTLGRPLDLLGFDACLMGMVEVAYQLRDTARVLVASQLVEPGDGWSYSSALAPLVRGGGAMTPEELGRQLVADYRQVYAGQSTLSAVRLAEVAELAAQLKGLVHRVRGGVHGPRALVQVDAARKAAVDCSPDRRGGYRDLGTFLQALGPELAGAADEALRATTLDACGPALGLSVYLPGDYRPDLAGSTDELYERLDFPADMGWASLLRALHPPLAPRPVRPARPTASRPVRGSLFGLDRHTAAAVLPALLEDPSGGRTESRRGPGSGSAGEASWADALRARLMTPVLSWARRGLDRLRSEAGSAPAEDLRIYIVPGMSGSMLSDRSGHHGLVWIDPVGLIFGSDFAVLRKAPGGLVDDDLAVRLEPSGVIPAIYDLLSLSLLAAFGPVVEMVPYDWRLPVDEAGRRVARRIAAGLQERPGRRAILIGHSQGGVVAGQAFTELGPLGDRVAGLVSMGVPWLGSYEAVLNLRGEGGLVEKFIGVVRRPREEVLDTVQTFWGLTDMLPANRPDLLDPRLYPGGALRRSPRAVEQLEHVAGLKRQPPVDRTLAIVSSGRTTLTGLALDGERLELEHGPGDGTVPVASATFDGALEIALVDEAHTTLPLHPATLKRTVEFIARQLQRHAAPLEELPPLEADDREPATRLAREEFLGPRTLGELLALLPIV